MRWLESTEDFALLMKSKLDSEELEPTSGDSKTPKSLQTSVPNFRRIFILISLVVCAKGIGNGTPLGAVITTPQIAKVNSLPAFLDSN